MSNVLTEKIYPETELKCVELANTVKLLLGTWVRVKRGKKRYLVYNEAMATCEVSATQGLKDLAIFTKEFQDSFIKRCLLCKYYWQVPKSIHKPPYVNIDGIPVVKKDNNHLSDKEEFMTKYRVL
tara:strand:+ start:2402 stop:2776 length:375 start_codon:yes stop_codon:yes gene_type:complete